MSGKIKVNSENDYLTSSDNGRTWKLTGTGSFNSLFNINKRIIAGSKKNLGLSYSDDGGVSWTSSNITSGNWGNIVYSTDRVYAGSFDNNGIVYSMDNGETWTYCTEEGNYVSNAKAKAKSSDKEILYMAGTSGISSVYKGEVRLVDINPSTLLSGNGNVYFSSSDRLEFDLHSKILSNEEIDGILLIIINKVVYPVLCDRILGTRKFIDSSSYVSLKNSQTKRIVVGNEDPYKIYRYTSIIDWENDIGMKKIGTITISDLLKTDTVDDVALNGAVENYNNNSKLDELIKKVSAYISYKKNLAFANGKKKITECAITASSDIASVSSSLEMASNNIEMLNTLDDAQKQSVTIILSKMLDMIFTFDEPAIRSLINGALIETVKNTAGNIKMRLLKANVELYKSGKEFVMDPSEFKFSYDFYAGLEEAFSKYMSRMSSNILVVNSNGDKDVILQASTFYKHEEREELINEAVSLLNKTSYKSSMYITEIQLNINDYFSKLKTVLKNSESLSAEDRKSAVDKITHTFEYDDAIQAKEILNSFFTTLRTNYYYNLQNNISFKYFENYNDSLDGFSTEEKDRAYGYLDEIHEKFLDRCTELLQFQYDNFPNIESSAELLNNRCSSEIYSKIKSFTEKAETLTTDNEIDKLFLFAPQVDEVYFNNGSDFITMIKNCFYSSREVI